MRRKTINPFLIAVLSLAFFSSPLFAAEETTGDYLRQIGTKFGRGLVNMITSPAELPCGIRQDVADQGGMGVISGFGKGIAFMFRRLLVGTTEVATFVIPMEATLPPVCHAAA